MRVCTIVARNYVAHARVLVSSLRRSNPGVRATVLVIDDHRFDVRDEDFDVLRPSDLEIGDDEFGVLASIYNVTELATALKPALLLHLLDAAEDPVLYLDPDIEVFAPLDDVERLAAAYGVVLVPHALESPPDDGLGPTEG